MHDDIKRRWVEALRSGDFPQSVGALQTPTGFCCLGVLCEIAVADHAASRDRWGYQAPYLDDGSYDDELLPEGVAEWAGLSDVSPDVGADALVELNDDGATFEELAVLIEKYL